MRKVTQKATKRSEELRVKRQPRQEHLQYSQQQIKRSTSQPTRAAVSRPVTSRGVINLRGVVDRRSAVSVPLHQRTQSRVNRQVTIPLNTAGAELRLPVIPNLRLGWRLISAALVFCVAALLVAMWNAPFFQLSQAKLVGAKRLSASDINTVLKVDGISVIQVSPRDMEKDLKDAFPDLSSVKVSVSLPAGLTVRVTERQPVITWKVGDTVQWVDKDGYAFPPRGDGGTLVEVDAQVAPKTANPAAILNGSSSSSSTPGASSSDTSGSSSNARFIDTGMVKAILTLGPQVPSGATILYSLDYGMGWNDPKGWQVYFGKNLEGMDTKLTQYQAIVAELSSEDIHPKLISVEFPRAPFYRLEQ